MKKLLSLTVIATLLTACAGTSDLGKGKTGKSITVSGYNYNQVWDQSLKSVKGVTGDQQLEIEKNLSITKEDKSTGTILATTGMSLLSWGEVVGVYITPAYDAPQHQIEVESRTKLQTNIFANNWEDELLQSIQANLKAAK